MDAIEVKNSARIRPEDLRGLKAVREDYPTARLMLLSQSTERLVIDGIMCMPVGEFLKALTPGRPLFRKIDRDPAIGGIDHVFEAG